MKTTAQDALTSLVSQRLRPKWARTGIPTGSHQGIQTLQLSDIAGQFPALANYVEEITDWDIPDSQTARECTVIVFPSTTPYFVVQYRTSVSSARTFGDTILPHRDYRHVATTLETGVVKICPNGPLGAVVVRLKPETAPFLLGDNMYEFADTKVDLGDIFNAVEIASLAETLAQSQSSSDRIVSVLQFLWANVRPQEPDPVVRCAAANLRRNPSLRVGLLANELGLSVRHLTRRFKRVFGMGPKRFARIARVEHVIATCRSGSAWAEVACSCGFSDQAHMINDFNAILGATPGQYFHSALTR
jgi:AraC-like DNA-binding protein